MEEQDLDVPGNLSVSGDTVLSNKLTARSDAFVSGFLRVGVWANIGGVAVAIKPWISP